MSLYQATEWEVAMALLGHSSAGPGSPEMTAGCISVYAICPLNQGECQGNVQSF